MRMVAITGRQTFTGKDAEARSLEASRRFRALQEADDRIRQEKRASRPEIKPSPLAAKLDDLIRSVEARLVQALWTETCLPNGGSGGSCGLAYMHDRADLFANAVAEGEWRKPSPGRPSPKAIDAMLVPLSWLAYLPRAQAELVRYAAKSKQGNPATKVSWGEVRHRVPSAREVSVSSLQRRYDDGLSEIAAHVLVE